MMDTNINNLDCYLFRLRKFWLFDETSVTVMMMG